MGIFHVFFLCIIAIQVGVIIGTSVMFKILRRDLNKYGADIEFSTVYEEEDADERNT